MKNVSERWALMGKWVGSPILFNFSIIFQLFSWSISQNKKQVLESCLGAGRRSKIFGSFERQCQKGLEGWAEEKVMSAEFILHFVSWVSNTSQGSTNGYFRNTLQTGLLSFTIVSPLEDLYAWYLTAADSKSECLNPSQNSYIYIPPQARSILC